MFLTLQSRPSLAEFVAVASCSVIGYWGAETSTSLSPSPSSFFLISLARWCLITFFENKFLSFDLLERSLSLLVTQPLPVHPYSVKGNPLLMPDTIPSFMLLLALLIISTYCCPSPTVYIPAPLIYFLLTSHTFSPLLALKQQYWQHFSLLWPVACWGHCLLSRLKISNLFPTFPLGFLFFISSFVFKLQTYWGGRAVCSLFA